MLQIGNCEELISIEYPGIVKDISKVVETLGGPEIVSDVLSRNDKKIQLRFRPKDLMCKPVNGSRHQCSAFVLKVKVKKKTQEIVSYEVIGIVKEEFKFNTLCDFQFLAMDQGVNVYDKIFPSSLNVDWLKGDAPLLLCPALFSRIDSMQGYYFAKDKTRPGVVEEPPKLISSLRRRRYGLARFVSFEDPEVPTEPKKLPANACARPVSKKFIEKLKQLLEERPIFSRCAMAGVSGISEKILKDVAPYAAYHFHNGPWRAMWVRFGYDPRIDPTARIYQTFDYRVRRKDEEELVEVKRASKTGSKSVAQAGKKNTESKQSDVYILKPGRLPPSRQFFYQYCDVHLPEVQALLAAVEVRSECHPTDGWLPEGTSFACRRIIKQYVLEAISQHRKEGAEPLSEYSSTSDGSESSDSEDTAP